MPCSLAAHLKGKKEAEQLEVLQELIILSLMSQFQKVSYWSLAWIVSGQFLLEASK